jgi:RimJ/RimL family protein N-acetyltransferase
MLQVSFKRVKSGKVDKLRAWMRELMDRRDEVVESFEQEGVRDEKAWLLQDDEGYILVYAIEAEDLDKARQAYRESTLPIDMEHREALTDVLGERIEPELLYDLAVGAASMHGQSEIYARGSNLVLRQPKIADAEPRYRWFADPRVTSYLPLAGSGYLPLGDIRSYLKQVIASTRPVFDVSIDLHDGTTVGSASYRDIVDEDSAELSIVIGEVDARGRGLGQEAMELMLDYGFEEMNLERTWLIVRADNEVAVGLFESLGFETVEVIEEAVVVDGVARDKLRMELARENWAGHRRK